MTPGIAAPGEAWQNPGQGIAAGIGKMFPGELENWRIRGNNLIGQGD